MYKILSLDGGGLRGLITVHILQRLNETPDIAGWLDEVDLVVGTSTGGILALGIAAGFKPEIIGKLYRDKGPQIFDDKLWDNIRFLGNILGAEYSNAVLRSELKHILGNLTLAQLQKKVAITAFDLDNEDRVPISRTWKPKIFHNFLGADFKDGDRLVADIAAYTCAAPTYFPSVDGYIDGGVFANNPSMVGLAQAISEKNLPGERAKVEDVVLLSIGTGVTSTWIEGGDLNWGVADWARPLLDILLDGVAGIADYQCRQFLGDRYLRVQKVFDRKNCIRMDDATEIPTLCEVADAIDIHEAQDWIRKFWT